MKKRQAVITALLLSSLITVSGCGSTAAASTSSDGTASASADGNTDSSNSEDPSSNSIDGLFLTSEDINFKDSDEYSDYTSGAYTTLTLNGTTAEKSGNGSVTIEDGSITITSEGTYVLSGSFNGTIHIDVGDDDKVILVLNNAEITSGDAPAINVINADKVTVSLPEGTDNSLTDGDSRSDEELDGVIYSTADLVLNGEGTLTISANFADGIHGKDDVRITGGTYVITAADDGISGKDRLEIKNSTMTVTAAGKGLKSTNTEDEGLGFLYIESGTFTINSEDDAIHGATAVWIADGTFTIHAGDDGIHGDETLTIDGGSIDITGSYEGLEAAEVVLNGGDINITASDDGVNAAGGNEDESTSNDDTFDPGTQDTQEIDRSAEETAAAPSENENGDMAGGPMGGKGGGMMDGMAGESEGYLYINGGTIHVNADGDGLDANTSIYQTGGDVIVEGPTNDGNGYFDYGSEYKITGGTVLGLGSTGMLQSVSDSSTVNCLTIIYDSQQSAGTTFTLKDSDGNVVAEYTSEKVYSAITYAGAGLETDAEYTYYADDTELASITMDSSNKRVNQSGEDTTSGGTGGMGMGGGMPRDGGMNRDENAQPPSKGNTTGETEEPTDNTDV